MNTKKQWARFCEDVRKAKQRGMEPYVRGDKVIDVQVYDNFIITKGTNGLRWKYDIGSVNDKSLLHIYRTVTLRNVTLADMKAKTITVYEL